MENKLIEKELKFLYACNRRLRRAIEVNNLFAMHGYPAKDLVYYHHFCQYEPRLYHYIDDDDTSITTAKVEQLVIEAIKLQKFRMHKLEQQEHKLLERDARAYILKKALAKKGLKLSKNSFLRTIYVEDAPDDLTLERLINIVDEQHFLTTQTNYLAIKEENTDWLGDNPYEDDFEPPAAYLNTKFGYDEDVAKVIKKCKKIALEQYFANGGKYGNIPNFLVGKLCNTTELSRKLRIYSLCHLENMR
jgi:hypothetical protein